MLYSVILILRYENHGKNRLIFVLELGQEDLMNRLQRLRTFWFSEEGKRITTAETIRKDIDKILRQVLEAVAEMHRSIYCIIFLTEYYSEDIYFMCFSVIKDRIY